MSDAVAGLPVEGKPDEDWIRHGVRAVEMILNQTVLLRKRQLVTAYKQSLRKGAYWSVRSELANYQLADAWPFDQELATRLAETPTRLTSLDEKIQNGLINWGYAIADTAIRKHVDPSAPRPTKLPYG